MERIRSPLRTGVVTVFLFVTGTLLAVPLFASLPGTWATTAVPIAATWLVLVARGARSGLYVSPAGLTIRKVWTTTFVARTDVEALDWTLSWFPNLSPCLVIRLRSGKGIAVPSVPAADKWFGSGSTTEEGLERLDARIKKIFSASEATPSK